MDPATRCEYDAPLAGCQLCQTLPLEKPRRQAHHVPQFSVIVPTYNRAVVLRECLQALDRQSLDPAEFEVIVVDDGSNDETARVLQAVKPNYVLQCLRQPNAGIGAARRAGVQQAQGRYLLLINDDTIAAPELLTEHLRVLEAYAEHKVAVLGNFHYPPGARKRALTQFLATSTFMFPQRSMHAGEAYDCSQLVTCNLSVPRAAVLAAGSFTGRLPVGEDTELGFRLRQHGFRVLFHPDAHAWHHHLQVTIASLVSRARQYGPVYLYLLRNYPELRPLMPVPFTDLQAGDRHRVLDYLEQRRGEIAPAAAALAKYDDVDFEPFYEMDWDGRPAAEVILTLFGAALPKVYWFYVYESLLGAWQQEMNAPLAAAGTSGAGVEGAPEVCGCS
jgi:glycosyltransferase involved in cell wall biosynthesis